MGSAASKGARRLPKNVASAAHPTPAVLKPPPEAPPRPAAAFEYGDRPKPSAANAPFSGEKDDNIIKDAMDPQFLANLQKLGPVAVDTPGEFMRAPSRAQRTLTARKKEYTNPSMIPPPGTASIATLTTLLDTLKSLPAGADPEPHYAQLDLKPEDMAAVRRWVNSPSVGEEEVFIFKDAANQTVEQEIQMTAIWVESKDNGARKL